MSSRECVFGGGGRGGGGGGVEGEPSHPSCLSLGRLPRWLPSSTKPMCFFPPLHLSSADGVRSVFYSSLAVISLPSKSHSSESSPAGCLLIQGLYFNHDGNIEAHICFFPTRKLNSNSYSIKFRLIFMATCPEGPYRLYILKQQRERLLLDT